MLRTTRPKLFTKTSILYNFRNINNTQLNFKKDCYNINSISNVINTRRYCSSDPDPIDKTIKNIKNVYGFLEFVAIGSAVLFVHFFVACFGLWMIVFLIMLPFVIIYNILSCFFNIFFY